MDNSGQLQGRKKVTRFAPYLLVRGRAESIPLLNNAIDLVIATPPYRGTGRVRQNECCTRNAEQYDALLCRFLEEAARIVKPGGYILLHTRWLPVKNIGGVQQLEFWVFRRRIRSSRQALEWVRMDRYAAPFVKGEGIDWYGLPVRLYRLLLLRYSEAGDTVAHVFSGSGNSAITALELLRVPILLDLHYHATVKRRLDEWIEKDERYGVESQKEALTSFGLAMPYCHKHRKPAHA